MDADGHFIPILKEDQGEGFKDPVDDPNDFPEELMKAYKEALLRTDQNQQAIITKILNKKGGE